MPKSRKVKGKYKDFQKVKLKIGKTLPKGANETTTAFKSRSVHVREQLKAEDSQPTTKRRLNINELLSQCQHYSTNVRQDAVTGLRELITTNPDLLQSHLAAILDKVAQLFIDKDCVVRQAVHRLLKGVFPLLTATQLRPFFPVLSAHLCCAMTHIYDDVQQDSLSILDLCLDYYPSLVTAARSRLMPNFVEQISRQSTAGSRTGGVESKISRSLLVNPNSKLSSHKWRVKVLARLHKFLKAIYERSEHEGGDQIGAQRGECTNLQWRPHKQLHIHMAGSTALHSSSQFVLRNEGGGTSTAQSNQVVSDDMDHLQSFIHTLVPLLVECWVESGPSQLATNLPGNALSQEALTMLSSVLNVLHLLLRSTEASDQQSDQMSSLQERYMQDFVHYFLPYFPYSMHQVALKDKTKKKKVPTATLR